MKNQLIGDLPKNLEQVKKIEELKNLRDPERKQSRLIRPVDGVCDGSKASKNVEVSKKVEHLKKREPLKILAENP